MCKLIILGLALSAQICAVTPDEALKRLTEGNDRFTSDASTHPDRTAERRQETAETQEPFATILGCSDSRVAPEIIFDQGIGDLFIVRVAGNVSGPLELDSIEYSVIYLHSSLIVVLGHENCGAVKAVLHGTTKDIESVAELIQPAVKKTKDLTKNRLESTIQLNAKMTAEALRKTPVLSRYIKEKKLDIVAGYYDFHDGKVHIFPQ
ncbi:MAG TPA: carbonic anhydrase [Rhabdochlamydiaceae bacterium]